MLIGIAGRAGSGKSTAARYLQDQYGLEHISFADPICNMLCALFADAGIDGAWAYERSLKEQPTTLGWSYRHLAQTLGTEWGRRLSEDFWVRVADHRVAAARMHGIGAVIADVRFPNEAHWIRAAGGVVVRIVRHGVAPVRAHESEAHADTLPVFCDINNNGSLLALHDQLDLLIDHIRTNKV